MTLPVWEVTRIGGKLGIQCPRKDCRQKAVVARAWLRSRTVEQADGTHTTIAGRSCTYCFKTARIPEELL